MKRLLLIMLACACVLIVYGCSSTSSHKEEVQAPTSGSSAQGGHYEDIARQFESAGFTNVQLEGNGELLLGIFHEEGDVEEVSIDGQTDFASGSWHNPESPVVIRFYSFEKMRGTLAEIQAAEQKAKDEKEANEKSQSAKEEDPDGSSSLDEDKERDSSIEDKANAGEASQESSTPPHIEYKDVSFTSERDTRGTYSTIYVVVKMTAHCETECGYDDQAIIYCKVNDREPYDMHPLHENSDQINGSYSNARLLCSTRFEANPGDTVSFWIDAPKSGASYVGLEGLADSLTNATIAAINEQPVSEGPSNVGGGNVCYFTPEGYAYHSTSNCRTLSRSTEIYETTVQEAKEMGLEPCDAC